MSTFAPSTIDLASRLDREAPAVEVRDLRKTFRRKDRKAGRFARKRPWPALDDVTFTIARGECVTILGQNGSGKSTLVRLLSTLLISDGGAARVFGHDVDRDASTIRRLVNRVSVEASFFKKMSASENLSYAARFYGMTPQQTRSGVPEILEPGRLPARAAQRGDGEPVARHAAEGRPRAGAPDLARPAAARRADDGPRPAVEARGAGVHPRRPRRSTTRRSSSARTTWPRRRRSRTGSGSSTAAGCSSSSRSRT